MIFLFFHVCYHLSSQFSVIKGKKLQFVFPLQVMVSNLSSFLLDLLWTLSNRAKLFLKCSAWNWIYRQNLSYSSWHNSSLYVINPSPSFLRPGLYFYVVCPMLVQLNIAAQVQYLKFTSIKKLLSDPSINMSRAYGILILYPSVSSVPSHLFVVSMWNVPIFHSSS